MSLRGRGCLEIRRSDNPFFQPVNGDLGQSLSTMPAEWKTATSSSLRTATATATASTPNQTSNNNHPHSQSPTPRSPTLPGGGGGGQSSVSGGGSVSSSTTASVDGHFAFLYSRESDRIGARVPKPDRPELPRLPMRRTTQRPLLENDPNTNNNTESLQLPRRTAEEVLQLYRHESKVEDPRYLTSAVSLSIPLSASFLHANL